MNINNKLSDAKELLKIHFGHKELIPGQEEAITNVLNSNNTVIIMPTGGGKSMCYQLPSLVLDGVTLVISPLISLMKDQVDALLKNGVPATFINSSLSVSETANRIEEIKSGKHKIIYIAPERFYNKEFFEMIKEVNVSLFAVDEAHCISQWGHDFRPSYKRLGSIAENLGSPPIIALTATATPEVKEDIVKQLKLDKPKVIITGFARENLQFGVFNTSKNMKSKLILDAVDGIPEKSGIIYVGTRQKADEIVQSLLDRGVEAASYHAGMDQESRKWVQEEFMKNKFQVIVATNAFGMGIDKEDIRFVIHHDLPGTLEAYYQEAGRAGRDGKESYCLLLYSSSDRYLREFFIKGDNPSQYIVEEVYDLLKSYESDTVLITYSELKKSLSEDVPEMAVGTCIKILEHEGFIKRSSEKTSSAFIRVLEPFERIFDKIGTRAKVQIRILEKLQKRFEAELLNGWDLNLEEIGEIIEEKKDSIQRVVKKLSELELLEYRPPFRGTELKIIKRVEIDEMDIDFSLLKEKAKSAYIKLDKMEEYVYEDRCRQRYILEYFGDDDKHNCGRCDLCISKGNVINKGFQQKQSKTFYRKKEVKEVSFDAPVAGANLSTKLTQFETLDLYKSGLDIDDMAMTRNLKPDTIVEHLCFLIEKGMDVNIDKFVTHKKQKEIKKIKEEIGNSKLSIVKEKLGNDFTWREIKLTISTLK
ncbi:recombinase RecQ [Candidatus Parcubacteria bacterium]|nr:MAG: recombinase RecQ [Candidatus Parcubacteria bacterium]